VPVDVNVAAILRAISPDFPTPETPGDDHAPFGAREDFDGARERGAEGVGQVLDGSRLEREDALAAIDELLAAGLWFGGARRLMHGRSPARGARHRPPDPRSP